MSNSKINEEESTQNTHKKSRLVSISTQLAENGIKESKEYGKLEGKTPLRMLMKSFLAITILFVLSVILSFARIKLSFIPNFIEIDFSTFPEFVILILFGPTVAMGTAVLKNFAHMAFYALIKDNVSYVDELSSLITDLLFIIFILIIYAIITKGKSSSALSRAERTKSIVASGIGSSVVTAFALLPVMYFLIYPLYVRVYAIDGITLDFLSLYTQKLSSITNLWQGLLIFNLPWAFSKLFVSTILTTITYRFLSQGKK